MTNLWYCSKPFHKKLSLNSRTSVIERNASGYSITVKYIAACKKIGGSTGFFRSMIMSGKCLRRGLVEGGRSLTFSPLTSAQFAFSPAQIPSATQPNTSFPNHFLKLSMTIIAIKYFFNPWSNLGLSKLSTHGMKTEERRESLLFTSSPPFQSPFQRLTNSLSNSS